MFAVFENKLDKFFEQFEVPREPVRSGMMAAVTQKLRGIWDEGKYAKFSKVTNEEAEKILTDKDKLVANLNKTINEVGNIKDVADTTETVPNVSKKTQATANFVCSKIGCKDASVVKKILQQMLTAIVNGANPKQIKITLNELAKNHHLNEQQVNGILKLLSSPDLEFNDLNSVASMFVKMAGVDSADNIAKGMKG